MGILSFLFGKSKKPSEKPLENPPEKPFESPSRKASESPYRIAYDSPLREAAAKPPAPKPIRKSGVNANPLPRCKNKRYRVAGTSFRKKEILALAKENPDYKLTKAMMYKQGIDCVYKYTFHPETVELVPEPDNPHDPKAVKVIMDGQHIGYIKAGNCAHILNILKSGDIRRIQGEITGGPSKSLMMNYDIDDNGNERKPPLSECTLETDNAMDFSVSVFVDERIK